MSTDNTSTSGLVEAADDVGETVDVNHRPAPPLWIACGQGMLLLTMPRDRCVVVPSVHPEHAVQSDLGRAEIL